MTKIFYNVHDQWHELELTFDFKSEADLIPAIKECANDYWHCHNAWQVKWPLNFILSTSQNFENKIGEVYVDAEEIVNFHCTIV